MQGTDWMFEAEANHKSLVPKSKPILILINQIRVRTNAESDPGSNQLEYYYAYTNIASCMNQIYLKYQKIK